MSAVLRWVWLASLVLNPYGFATAGESGVVQSARCGLTIQHTNACMVSIDELVAKGEFFNGRVISLAGYMSVDFHRLTVYASKYAYDYLDERRSLVIRDEPDNLELWRSKYRDQIVRVTGEFRVELRPGEGDFRAGSLRLVATPIRLGPRVVDEASKVLGHDPHEGP